MLVGVGHDLLAGHRLVQKLDRYLVHQALQQAVDLSVKRRVRFGERLVVVGVQQHGRQLVGGVAAFLLQLLYDQLLRVDDLHDVKRGSRVLAGVAHGLGQRRLRRFRSVVGNHDVVVEHGRSSRQAPVGGAITSLSV